MFNALTGVDLRGSEGAEAASVYPRLLLPLHLGGTWGASPPVRHLITVPEPRAAPSGALCCPAARQIRLNVKTAGREAEGKSQWREFEVTAALVAICFLFFFLSIVNFGSIILLVPQTLKLFPFYLWLFIGYFLSLLLTTAQRLLQGV